MDFDGDENLVFNDRNSHRILTSTPEELMISIIRCTNDERKFKIFLDYKGIIPSAVTCCNIIAGINDNKIKLKTLKYMIPLRALDIENAILCVQNIKDDECIIEAIAALINFFDLKADHCLKLLQHVNSDEFRFQALNYLISNLSSLQVVGIIESFRNPDTRLLALEEIRGKIQGMDVSSLLSLFPPNYKRRVIKVLWAIQAPIMGDIKLPDLNDESKSLRAPVEKINGDKIILNRNPIIQLSFHDQKKSCSIRDDSKKKKKEVKLIEYPETGVDIKMGEKDDDLCIVCFENRQMTICLPCAHMCLCFKCSKDVALSGKGCPYCQETLTSIKTVRKVQMN